MREGIEHGELRGGFEEQLLIVLAVDIAQMRRQILQQRDRRRPVVDVDAALAVRQDLALEQQFGVRRYRSRPARAPSRRFGADLENAGNARPLLAGADHVARRAAAEQQPERIHHDRLAASGFAGEQVQTGMKPHAQTVDHGVIFDHQFVQHSIRL